MFDIDLVRSVLRVERQGRVYGTAFVVALEGSPSQQVVTCAHVLLEALEGQQKRTITLCSVADGAPTFALEADARFIHDRADIATLPFEDTGIPPLLVASDDHCEGHDLQTYGFTASSPEDDVGRMGRWGYGRIVAPVGSGLRRRLQLRDCDAITSGFSGAPVFDLQSRRVIAVLTDIARVDPQLRGRSTAFGIPPTVLAAVLPRLRKSPDRPYRGLDAFTEADAKYWVDPGDVKTDVLKRLDGGERLTVIIGPSGVGKSSLLHAGLLPELRKRAAEQCTRVAHMRLNRDRVMEAVQACRSAGDEPASLSAALRGVFERWTGEEVRTQHGLVVLLDQFEEALLVSAGDGSTFIKALTALLSTATNESAPLHLVIALREYFLGVFGDRAPELKRRFVEAAVHVPLATTRAKLESIVRDPAVAAGRPWSDVAFIDGVVSATMESFATEDPGSVKCTSFPLLQVFLARQWDARERFVAPSGGSAGWVPDYAAKSLQAALGTLIDDVVTRLASTQAVHGKGPTFESLVAQLLTRFVAVGLGQDPAAPKGRSRLQSELERSMAPEAPAVVVQAMIRALVEGRVLTARSGTPDGADAEVTLELVHDAAIGAWKPMREPLLRQRAFNLWHASVRGAALELAKLDARPPREQRRARRERERLLLSGGPLEVAREWVALREPDVEPAARGLVRASMAADRLRRWKSAGLAGLAGLAFLTALGAAGYKKYEDGVTGAVESAREKDRARAEVVQARKAAIQRSAEEILILGEEPRALASSVLAAEDVESETDAVLRRQILSSLMHSLLAFELHAPLPVGARTKAVALTEDGSEAVFLATGENDDTVEYSLWELAHGRLLRSLASQKMRFLALDGSWETGDRAARDLENGSESIALLVRGTNELWLTDAADGVRRIPVVPDKGASTSIMSSARGATVLAQSTDGKTVAVGTDRNGVLVYDVRTGNTQILPHPTPVLRLAVASGGAGVVTEGPKTGCFFAGDATCRTFAARGFGSVAISDDGQVAGASSFEFRLFSANVESLTILSKDGRTLLPTAWVAMDLSHYPGSSDPVVLRGLMHGRWNQVSMPFPHGTTTWKKNVADGEQIEVELKDPSPATDGTWRRQSSQALYGCERGVFDYYSAACGATTVIHRADGSWFRLNAFADDSPKPRAFVVALDATRRLGLVERHTDGNHSSLELVKVGPDGLGDTLNRVPCEVSWGDFNGELRNAVPASLPVRCDGKPQLVRVEQQSVSARLTVREDARGAWTGHDFVDPHEPARAAFLTPDGHAAVVDLDDGRTTWTSGTELFAQIVTFDRGVLVAQPAAAADQLAVFVDGQRTGNLAETGSFGFVEVLSSRGSRLLRTPDRLTDVSGTALDLSFLGHALRGFSQDETTVSPDGAYISIAPDDASPVVGRLDGNPPRIEDPARLGPDGPPNPKYRRAAVRWLPATKRGEARILVMGGGRSDVWTHIGTQWRPTAFSARDDDYDLVDVNLSPSGNLAVVNWKSHIAGGPTMPYPTGLAEVRDTSTWEVIGVWPVYETVGVWSAKSWFIGEDAVLLSQPSSVKTLRPEALRREACDLLVGRPEFDSVREICNGLAPSH